jgi:hypothetical protein
MPSFYPTGASYGVLPTPSPELDQASLAQEFFGNHGHPTWETLRAAHPVSAGTKRSHDYAVEEFFTDMKKRRLAPSYDPRKWSHIILTRNTLLNPLVGMIERLSNLAYLSGGVPSNQSHQSHGGSTSSGYGHTSLFNPRSVSFDIHTPEELAAVNEFLITLGREVTTTTRAHPVPPRQPAREFDDHHGHSYFNAAGLSELGLTGMPGVMNSAAGSGASFSDAVMYSSSSSTGFPPYLSRSANQSVSVPGINFAAPQPTSLFPDVSIPFFPELPGRRGDASFGSTVSTPSSMSDAKLESPPPFPNRTLGYRSPGMLSPHSDTSTPPAGVDFDFVRASRGPPPTAYITPHDYQTRTQRTPLKTLPDENRAEPAPPKSLKLAPSTDSGSGSDSLRRLLTSGSGDCTLAPLHLRRERSSSPSTSSSRSGSSTPEPRRYDTILPSLKTVTSGISTERLASSVRDIEIESQAGEADASDEDMADEPDVEEEEQRREHARLIKDLLIYINSEYKKKHGAPGEEKKDRLVGSRTLMGPGVPGIQRPPSNMDIEMTVS